MVFFSLVNYYQLHLKFKMTFEVYSLMFKFINFAQNMSHEVQLRIRYMHTKGYRKAGIFPYKYNQMCLHRRKDQIKMINYKCP